MIKAPSIPKQKSASPENNSHAFELRPPGEADPLEEKRTHVYGKCVVCDTEPRGHRTHRDASPVELVLNHSEGFIPLWAKGMTLHWRFQDRSLMQLSNPNKAKGEIRELLSEAILAWGRPTPINFKEEDDVWDFEIVVRTVNETRNAGSLLASSFFPDSGRHKFIIYPDWFGLSREEQVDTLIHELGHVFGLRHFFANIEDDQAAFFGTQRKFTIMTYGPNSTLTKADKTDLRRLYEEVWNGTLTSINGTPIRLMKPFNTLGT
ncbi:matrixin family metalloprotease [Chryseolinea sp. T2]|uniref:matrixin family metalloprotease n=1 Tax=Chryseolinea sp. T2 TaxID=3129255 RepID=UPI003076D383